MIVYDVTKVSLESFRERSKGKKVVLLYPWTNYRNLFLSHFLASEKEGLLYFRVKNDPHDLATWLADLATELNDVLGNFGGNLASVLDNGTPEVLAQALAADLAAYHAESDAETTTLFVDELDRAPLDQDFSQFIVALVSSLSENVQLAISSRLLTHQPWYNMVAHGDAVVMGTEHRKDNVMFRVEEAPKPQLEVYSLGRGYALVNGQPITNWDGALPRNLFFYFMDHPLVTRDEIFKTFWPDLNVKEATNVFHVTKRKISERIGMKVGEPGSYELTQYNGGFYMPSDKVVRHYDVGDFQEAIERAMITGDEREEELLLAQSIDVYKAPFLQSVEMTWVVERREHLRQLITQALIGMGRIYKRRQDDVNALGFFTRALKETPEREDIHREVMAIYLRMSRYEDARAQYRLLEQILHERLGIGPSRESRDLYNLIESQG